MCDRTQENWNRGVKTNPGMHDLSKANHQVKTIQLFLAAKAKILSSPHKDIVFNHSIFHRLCNY